VRADTADTLPVMSVTSVNLLFALLTALANLAVLAFVVLAIGARWSAGLARRRDAVWDRVAEMALPLAAIVAWVAMSGSLYYSEVARFIPCELCWYQRIAMYPLAIVLLVAAIRRDRSVRAYVLPLAAIGAVISAYHYQLERFPEQSALASCSVEAPCTLVWVWEFHYISIPFMALSGFALIAALAWIAGQPVARVDTR
jgi:disulfide bond formation protein DsbB